LNSTQSENEPTCFSLIRLTVLQMVVSVRDPSENPFFVLSLPTRYLFDGVLARIVVDQLAVRLAGPHPVPLARSLFRRQRRVVSRAPRGRCRNVGGHANHSRLRHAIFRRSDRQALTARKGTHISRALREQVFGGLRNVVAIVVRHRTRRPKRQLISVMNHRGV